MLCGLVEPRLLVRMSRTPAHSSTARTGPPAITPVPDAEAQHAPRRFPRAPQAPQAPQSPPLPRSLRRPRRPRRPRPQTRPRLARLPAFPVRSPLKLQSTFPGAVGHRLHAPVVLIAGAVEHDLGDTALLRLGRDQLSQREALRGLALAVDVDALGAIRRARERHPAGIVHELRVDVLRRAEHDEPRATAAPHHLLADPQAPPGAAG